MNGKRKFSEYLTLKGEKFSKELLEGVEGELMENAEACAKERGSRLIKSSVEYSYVIRKGYMDVYINWTELFTD